MQNIYQQMSGNTFAIHAHILDSKKHNTRSKWTIYRLDLYHYIDSVVLFSSVFFAYFVLFGRIEFDW